MVKIWRRDTTQTAVYTDAHFADMAVQKIVNPYVARSQPIRRPLPTIVVQLEPGDAAADFFTCATMRIVSAMLKEMVETHVNHGVQFLPVDVLDPAQMPVQDAYFFMHIVETVDCFDWEQSKYEMSDNARFMLAIDRLVLHPVDTSVHKIFRVAGISPFVLCVDESIATAILDAGCTGAAFLDPLDARW